MLSSILFISLVQIVFGFEKHHEGPKKSSVLLDSVEAYASPASSVYSMSFQTFHELLISKKVNSECKIVKIDYINWIQLRNTDKALEAFKSNNNIQELIIGPPKHLPIDGPQDEYFKVYSRFPYYFPLDEEVIRLVFFIKEKVPNLKTFTLDTPGDCEKWEIFKSWADFEEKDFSRTFGHLPRHLKGYISWNVLVRPDEFLAWFPKPKEENKEEDSETPWQFEAEDAENIGQIIAQALKDRKFPDDFNPKFSQSFGIETHPDFTFRITFNCRWNHFKFDEYEAKYKEFVAGKKWTVIGDFSEGFPDI